MTPIMAPAGEGKTVLLAQWVSEHPEVNVIWIFVDESDNDAVRFAGRLLQGLSVKNPQVHRVRPLLLMCGVGMGTSFLEALVAQIAGMGELVIILDDFHKLSNVDLLRDLAQLAHLLPSNAHLILSTRVELPIGSGLREMSNENSELHREDLAFDVPDAGALIERISGWHLEDAEVAELVRQTEGWVIGLQLAALRLSNGVDPKEFVQQFAASGPSSYASMSGEVLRMQPERVLDFLLSVSVADEICGDLAQALTGEDDAHVILSNLAGQSMFLLPVDARGEWYRFHHLFRDLLRFQLQSLKPGLEPELLIKGSDWHLERGEVTIAIEYLLRARAWTRAMELILSRGTEAFEKGEMDTVIRWIEEIPLTVRGGRLDVELLLGLLHAVQGHESKADDILQRFFIDPAVTRGERTAALGILSSMAQLRANPEVSLRASQRALRALTETPPEEVPLVMHLTTPRTIETVAIVSAGRAHFMAGRFADARAWLHRALVAEGATYSIFKIHVVGSLGLVNAWCGATAPAIAFSAEAIELARESGRMPHGSLADAYLAGAFACLERGETQLADVALSEAMRRGEPTQRNQVLWFCQLGLALLQEAEGRPDDAMATVLASPTKLASHPSPIVADRTLGLRSRILRVSGHPEEAQRVLAAESNGGPSSTFESVACALTLGDISGAGDMIATAACWLDDPRIPLQSIEKLILTSWLAHLTGVHGSKKYFDEAMTIGEQHALVEVFVRTGPIVLDLMTGVSAKRQSFRRAILERARRTSATAWIRGPAEPLTRREADILSYFPSRLTNAQLAEECGISVNTVKTHMARIFRKLDVENRDQAIIRARQLGLF